MAAKDIRALTFLDIETTGTDRATDAILEVGIMVVDLKTRAITAEYESLVKPPTRGDLSWVFDLPPWWDPETGGWALPEYHLNKGTFRDADWSKAKPLEYVLKDVADYLPGCTLAGQNPVFDRDFLQRDFQRAGITWPDTDYHLIDVAPMALPLVMAGTVPGVSLYHTRTWAGCSGEQRHRAFQDLADTIQVFFCLVDTFTLGLDVDAGWSPWTFEEGRFRGELVRAGITDLERINRMAAGLRPALIPGDVLSRG